MTQVNRTNELMTVCRSSAGVPAVGAAPPGGRRGCGRGRWARFPRTKACTGGSRLWFPILRSEFQKRPSSCGKLRGRRWVRTTGFSLVRRKQLTIRSSSQTRLHALDLRKPCPEMPRSAWESLHGGSRKWFPEQRPRSRQSGTEQRLLAPLPVTGTSALAGLTHQVRTGTRPSMPQPGQDSASAIG